MEQADVIVIGGGHAGVEAAAAADRLGVSVMLVSLRMDDLGVMSCNPAIGGVGKGHLVREIDALDGIMARAADRAGIQFRVLNRSKGHAVHGLRSQIDRDLYLTAVNDIIRETNIRVVAGKVTAITIDNSKENLKTVILEDGRQIKATCIVITTGTFLSGLMHCGSRQWEGGRLDGEQVTDLAVVLRQHGLIKGRLKTGTPPRLRRDSIAWQDLEEQKADNNPVPFSMLTQRITLPQISCYITHTTPATHKLINDNIDKSPMYSGQIRSAGPRYCPSIEDKIVRFASKQSHQIFLEPEGLESALIYPNGISTSLPAEIQQQVVATIPGLENVVIEQHGYAVEYDYADARKLKHTLEVKTIPGLFLAGQINGTTGYEEAAAQGLVAGANAALHCKNAQHPFVIERSEGYIGVLIDDLVTRGTDEPYRMFTSRAEYRLLLRPDNADQRLTDKGIDHGIVSKHRKNQWLQKKDKLAQARAYLKKTTYTPAQLAREGLAVNQDGAPRSVWTLLGTAVVDEYRLSSWLSHSSVSDKHIVNQLRIEAGYEGYLKRQQADIAAYNKDALLKLPENMDYSQIGSLSGELVQKLQHYKPSSLAEAGRIPGMTPAAQSILLKYVTKHTPCMSAA